MSEAIIGTLVSSVIGGVVNAYSSSQSNKASKANRENQAFYQSISKPNPAAIAAAGIQNRGELGQARQASYQDLASNLAARGFGSGSGMGFAGASNIEGQYLQGLGKQQTELTKYANTPFFAPPSTVFGQPATSSTAAGLTGATSPLQTAMGFYTMKNMFGNQSDTGIPLKQTNYYGQPTWEVS